MKSKVITIRNILLVVTILAVVSGTAWVTHAVINGQLDDYDHPYVGLVTNFFTGGVNGNPEFLEGLLGIRCGSAGLVVNYGKTKDDIELTKTPISPRGVHGEMSKEITGRLTGISGEYHKGIGKNMEVFLGGGITDCWEWQWKTIYRLEKAGVDCIIFNPKRENFCISEGERRRSLM